MSPMRMGVCGWSPGSIPRMVEADHDSFVDGRQRWLDHGLLTKRGKRKPTGSQNRRKNHERIGSAIKEANAGLGSVTRGIWGLSRDHHYQLANRFAWSWKLAMLGVPVVLLYLGFLNADEMDGALFRTEDDWACALKDHARGVVDNSGWGNRLDVNGTSFWPLIRAHAIDLPLST